MTIASLVVRAEDFGLCHAANQAVCEAFEVGVLTSALLRVACPWVAEAVELVQAHPEWEIGLQLSLRCETLGCRWGPVAGAGAVPSLATPTGTFAATVPAAADAADIRRELAAQLERCRAWGVEPAYLECADEEGAAVADAVAELGRTHGLPTRTRLSRIALPATTAEDREMTLLNALASLPPGVHLWVTRPAHDTPETWGLWPYAVTQQRQDDVQILCSAAVREQIRQRGIRLIPLRQAPSITPE